ncbi:sensor histidine kinase [Undibacterium rugosum]|uniref:Histidine kinase n=1 Tax=Undibacterium rugosum TaxID=2762291 RepID=A0A923IC26_9BURK|nr:histidine kinase [Undibacterium rugosum]MBC3936600.1 histidine kinase [Undibacterium rugosum]MBR7776925.1 histidine kinase [Undibacterium rugosum]
MVTMAYANWSQALLFLMPVTVVYSFLSTSAYYICRIFPHHKRAVYLAFLIFVSAAFLSALACVLISSLWLQILHSLYEDAFAVSLDEHVTLIIFGIAFALYLLNLFAYDVFIALDHMHAAERREADARLLARDAELQVLRSQIDPHFLFNSLNSISALTAIDPAAAREMTIALADFFRLTLSLSEKEKITVQQETELCEQFLAVEKIRFGHKLQSNIQVDELAQVALIPPMILQPLLENAIKHGIRNLRQGGEIQVRIQAQSGWLHLQVINPVALQDLPGKGNGLGLQNLKQRFHALYADQARVSWNRTETEFLIEIALPLELAHE